MTTEKQIADALRLVLAHNETYVSAEARKALAAYDRLSYNPGMTVDRLLGLADQFLSDWDDTSRHESDREEYEEHQAEWDEWRPRIVACVKACVAIAVMEAHSIDNIIGTAQGALK